MPIIALTPNWDEAMQAPCIPYEYETAVMHAGGTPITLPMTDSLTVVEEALALADALILTGGADINPFLYGEDKLPECGVLQPRRDQLELMVYHAALRRKMPILGICRGHQLVNVANGGSLYQDIAAQTGSSLVHPRHDAPQDCVHEVTIVKDSLLYQVLGVETLTVNSRHHQAVHKLGHDLRVTATAPDGTIEAVEFTKSYPMLCVQWHPENIDNLYPQQKKIFDWLMNPYSL